MTERLRVAWLTTGRGPGSFGALEYTLRAIEEHELAAEIAVVFLNRARGEADPSDRLIALAEAHGIAVETLSSVAFRKEKGGALSRPGEPLQPWRLDYDAAVASKLARYDFELGVMFGYMLIATEPLHTRFRFINDHPALPDGPIGTYQEVIRSLIASGATESGCMMNLVTGDVDRGPVLSFCRYGIKDDSNAALWAEVSGATAAVAEIQETPLFQDVRARGVRRERPFLVETLRAVAAGSLALPPPTPLDLTDTVESAISRADL